MNYRQSVVLPVGVQLKPVTIPVCAPALLMGLFLAVLNPVGYLGGDLDDWHYLDAARCIVENGICLPQTHWAARLTMVLPTATTIALFGESREALSLTPLAFGIAGTVSFAFLMERHFGRQAATIGTLILVSTPVIGTRFLLLNIDIVEFGAAMLALLALDVGIGRKDWRWLTGAGALLGVAMLARSTSAVLIVMVVAGLLISARARLITPVLAGVLALLALEGAFYYSVAGNPFHGWALSLGHTGISRSALAPNVDLTESPLFNPEFIAGWRQTMGLYIHWTIDGAINNLLNPVIGLTLASALVLMIIGRDGLDRRHWLLLGAGSCYFGALVYGLAVHPQPRMFVPTVAAAAAIAGSIAAGLWARGDKALVAVLLAGLGFCAVALSARAMDMRGIEPVAIRWAAERGGGMVIDERTRRTFTLAPSLNRLPAPTESDDRFALVLAMNSCPEKVEGDDRFRWTVSRSILFDKREGGDAYRLCELVRVNAANRAGSLRP